MFAKSYFVAFVILLSASSSLLSQSYWESSLSYGVAVYHGDMTREFLSTKDINPAAQLSLNRHFDKQHAVRLNLLYGSISGNDSYDNSLSKRGNAFTANVFEASIIGQIDLIGDQRFSKHVGFKRTLTPYFFVGAGVIFADPKVRYGDPNNRDAAIDYPIVHIFAPVGGGLKYDLSLKTYIGLEAAIRFTTSDYLDGVQASGNAYNNDGYIFTGLTVGYRFIN